MSDEQTDPRIARLAARQRGNVTTGQLREIGLSTSGIAHRVRTGRLHPVFRGVYRVGHTAPIAWSKEAAALLACGPSAVLSHLTAALLWQIIEHDDGPIHLTTPDRGRRSRPGLKLHHPSLAPDTITIRGDLKVTSPLRTLTDIASLLSPAAFGRAANEAQVLRLVSVQQLRKGPPALRALAAEPGFTRKEGERRLRTLLRRAGLRPTATNAMVLGREVDVLFADQELIVEMDGWAAHGTRHAFERDRRRDQQLLTAGYRTIRITWRQLVNQPEAIVATIAAALAYDGLGLASISSTR